MEECDISKNTGLRGVSVATTNISDVDGTAGKLIYRGYLARDLAGKTSFEEVAFLLLNEKLPDKEKLQRFRAELAAERAVPAELIAALKTRPRDALPMDILQAGVAMLAHHDADAKVYSREAAKRIAIRLIARTATIVAAWDRLRNGKEPVPPDPELGHAANFFYMLNGEVPDDEISGFFDACLVLHAEHAFNASTFAAREVASTRAHMYAAVAAAVGALSGELHGGANQRVMEMLKKIGSIDNVESFVNSELDAGRKVMGLGHAVYKTDDPRALILAPMSKIMGQRAGEPQWYEMSKHLEAVAKQAFKTRKGIDIFVNVDYYSASLYYCMGIPVDLFTPVFAVSRISGWTAHVIEEQYPADASKPALYRPASDYVGNYCGPDECAFVPIENR